MSTTKTLSSRNGLQVKPSTDSSLEAALSRGMTVRRAAYLIGWTIPQRVAEAVVFGIECVSRRGRPR